MIKDSGKRTTFQTGAVRDMQENKGRMDLLPMGALLELSKHFEMGCQKYGERNWEKGIELHAYVSSGLRHMAQFISNRNDEPHLTATVWNFICLLDTIIKIKEGTLPKELNTLPIDLDELMLHWRKEND